jgi:hypothetical protein
MFEGKIYECNGTNGRQGVAIMVSNECKEKRKKSSKTSDVESYTECEYF